MTKIKKILPGLLSFCVLVLSLSFPHSALAAGTNLSNTPLQPSLTPDTTVSGNNVYTVWSEGNTSDIFLRKSTNGGNSFESAQLISGSLPGDQPTVAVSDDNIYVAWDRGAEIVFTRSIDGAITFETPRMIYQNVNGADEAQIAAGTNAIHLTWHIGIPPDGNTDVLYTRSLDNGLTFTNPINISNSPNMGSDNAQVATNSNGKDIYFVWVESTPGGDVSQVFFIASHNSGANFLPRKILQTGNPAVDLSRVATNSNGNVVSVAWRDFLGSFSLSDTEVSLTQSFNSGATFGNTINVSGSPSVSSAHPELSANSLGIISVAWIEGGLGVGGQEDVFLRQIFSSVLGNLVNVSQTPEASNFPTVGIDGVGNSYVAWQEHTDPLSPEVFFSKIIPQF